MSRLVVAFLSVAALALFNAVPVVYADQVTEVKKFTGTATDIGVVRGPGQIGGVEYRIHGEFRHPAMDLTHSTFVFKQAFVEPDSPSGDGAGELMTLLQGPGGPETDKPWPSNGISMNANKGEPDEAKYDTPGRFRPQIRVHVERSPIVGSSNDRWKFDVRLDRGLARVRPNNCLEESDGRTRALITISFSITDNLNPGNPLIVA